MKRLTHLLVLIPLLLTACTKNKQVKQPVNKQTPTFSSRTEMTFGNMFCTLYMNEEGKGQVIKGYHTDAQLIEFDVTDTSKVFQIDSIRQFYTALHQLAANPSIYDGPSHDTQIVKVYLNEMLIFYGNMNKTFWSVFLPIVTQAPEGFNPFEANEGNPFSPK